jgi:hypothetical protein
LLSLVSKQSFLQAWQHWWLGVLKEGDDHEGESITRQKSKRCSNNSDGFCPPFDENIHDVEALVNLGVGENEVGVCDAQQVVDVKVHLDA